jgi:hypothetical protein
MKKATRFLQSILGGEALRVHVFGAGDVEKLLRIESWRLQKFLSSSRYQLTPSGRLGKDRQGSRRLFRLEDLYRIAIADLLVRDGFSPKFVSRALQFIENSDLLRFDDKGRERPPLLGVIRGLNEPEFAYISRLESRKGRPYYVIDLGQIVEDVDGRVHQYTAGDE